MRTAIVGGGASGLMAAIFAAMGGGSVTVYEGAARCGRKLLATGNGRCNMTNINASIENYHGKDTSFMRGVMSRFWVEETLDAFESMGILPKTDQEGRVYPNSDQASSVLDVLRLRAEALGVKTVTGFEVMEIKRSGGGFLLRSYKGDGAQADTVVIATGGRAAPDLGAKGGGYELLKKLGHHITELRPSLVQIKTAGDTAKKLKGMKFTGEVRLGEYSRRGEILFTDNGLSGIPIFSLTSCYDGQREIALDLMDKYSEDEVYTMLCMRAANNPGTPLESWLTGMLNKRIGQVLMKENDIAPLSRKACTLSDGEIRRLAHAMKDWRFRVEGTLSWNSAQVTKGGAVTSEFDPATLESRLVKGLYAAGEVLDIDGDCGGYNLQWAWASGAVAGSAAARLR